VQNGQRGAQYYKGWFAMDFKLQLVVVPVSDMDRAKDFYISQAGFGLHVDTSAGEHFRVIHRGRLARTATSR
jgi:hypothetical protein